MKEHAEMLGELDECAESSWDDFDVYDWDDVYDPDDDELGRDDRGRTAPFLDIARIGKTRAIVHER